jgi:hypothetical protein
MAGLDPATHANTAVENKTWVAASGPAMTNTPAMRKEEPPLLYVFNRYPVLKIQATTEMQMARTRSVMPRLMAMWTSDMP